MFGGVAGEAAVAGREKLLRVKGMEGGKGVGKGVGVGRKEL